MLEIVNLECIRGDRRLFTGLNFELAGGELLHLHGHNGSGKTTLMRTICGLISPSDGEVRWQGKNVRRLRFDTMGDFPYRCGPHPEMTGVVYVTD